MKYLILIGGLMLAGCNKSQKAQDLDIIWYDGKCLLVAEGMSIEQAKEIKQDWKFEACKIETKEN